MGMMVNEVARVERHELKESKRVGILYKMDGPVGRLIMPKGTTLKDRYHLVSSPIPIISQQLIHLIFNECR